MFSKYVIKPYVIRAIYTKRGQLHLVSSSIYLFKSIAFHDILNVTFRYWH